MLNTSPVESLPPSGVVECRKKTTIQPLNTPPGDLAVTMFMESGGSPVECEEEHQSPTTGKEN